jgi:hypothetical protein
MLWKRGFAGILLGGCLALTSGVVRTADLVVEVIRLQHRTAEQILPLIQPIVTSGTANGAGTEIVVRTTRSNLLDVKKVIAQLDRAPRRLVVTVRQDAPEAGASDSTSITRIYSTREADSDRAVQRVRVSDGHAAYVYFGQSVPVVLHAGGRPVRGDGRAAVEPVEPVVAVRETLSGFVVRPRVSGEWVSVDIEPRHDVPGSHGRGSIQLQRIATTVEGRIGTWIELGAVQSADGVSTAGTSYSTRSTTVRPRRILVRVDAVD